MHSAGNSVPEFVSAAEVPPGAKACPECGSDEKTGWSEAAHYDNLDLPDENFDYEDFVKREFGGEQPSPWHSLVLVGRGDSGRCRVICLWLR